MASSSSSRARSSSPFELRKPPSSSYSSSSSSNGRLIPRSCSPSVSSHLYGSGSGITTRSMTPNRTRSDSYPYPSSRIHGNRESRTPVGFPSAEELAAEVADSSRSGDSISVTIRFRPLSEREFQRGDELAWYADGEKVVRSEYNPATAYAFDSGCYSLCCIEQWMEMLDDNDYLHSFIAMTMSTRVTILLHTILQITFVRWLLIIILKHLIFWTTINIQVLRSVKDFCMYI